MSAQDQLDAHVNDCGECWPTGGHCCPIGTRLHKAIDREDMVVVCIFGSGPWSAAVVDTGRWEDAYGDFQVGCRLNAPTRAEIEGWANRLRDAYLPLLAILEEPNAA